MDKLDTITNKLLKHPYLGQAKHVKEINPGHLEDSVYTHLVETADCLRQHRSGDFITNPKAKQLFLDFMRQEIAGTPRADILILGGLLHDIGKIMSYKEEGVIYPVNQKQPNTEFTYAPHHGYCGLTIIRPLLQEMGVAQAIIDYISNIVRLHLVPVERYKGTEGYNITDAINDLKPRMEGFHVEVSLLTYADLVNNPRQQGCWRLVGDMLNEPHLYSTREYLVT